MEAFAKNMYSGTAVTGDEIFPTRTFPTDSRGVQYERKGGTKGHYIVSTWMILSHLFITII